MFTKVLLTASFLTTCALAASNPAEADTFASVYTFASNAGAPIGPLNFDKGIIYGATEYGGTSYGSLFKLDLTTQTFTTLYSYKAVDNVPFYPSWSLVRGSTLYVASSGTDANGGVGFISKYGILNNKEKSIYQFRSGDGQSPVALISVAGLLYGVCTGGGGLSDGTVFSVDPKTGSQTTIASFNGKGNGASPIAIVSEKGILYGVTSQGGASGNGTIFSINPAGGGIKLLYTFAGGEDGGLPTGLIVHGGSLYGTTDGGGNASSDGVVFKFNLSSESYKTIHVFKGNADGYEPNSVTFFNGELYGTTYYGLRSSQTTNPGTVFKMGLGGGNFEVIHSFAGTGDGAFPQAPLVVQNGLVYGSTTNSFFGPGTIFSVTP